MKAKLPRLAFAAVLLSTLSSQLPTALAQGNAFTYQGRLSDNAGPVNGSYDFNFQLFDAASGGASQGPLISKVGVTVSDGLFTVTLDFGASPFSTGDPRWLEIKVRTNNAGAYGLIDPRLPLTATPYAVTAGNVVSGGLAAGTYTNALTLNNPANSLSGAFTGNGANVTNVNAATLNGLTGGSFWKIYGNAGANPTNNQFLGTTDNLPLEFWVNAYRALRLEHAYDSQFFSHTPNVIGGSPANLASNGIAGAFIGGGGNSSFPNCVGDNYAAVLGGYANTASGRASTAAGFSALASGDYSTAMGYAAVASGARSTAMGYLAHATNHGTFVWSDSSDSHPFTSTANNQFLLRASGGVGIGTTSPTLRLTVGGAGDFNTLGAAAIMLDNTSANGRRWEWHSLDDGRMQIVDFDAAATRLLISPNGFVGIGTQTPTEKLHVIGNILASGTINGSSDRNVKEHFVPVNPREVLDHVAALPISRWNYKTETDVTHLGPMAQDFYSAFAVGMDDKHISMVDADGVALAAIQGLNQKLMEELHRRDAENTELKHELAEIRQLLTKLSANRN